MAPLPLAFLLLRASHWFDRRLLDGLQQRGWPALSPAQSLVFAHLDPEGLPPAELARRLGQTRQATSEVVRGLVRLGLLEIDLNPRRRGGRLVLLTQRGRALVRDAQQLLAELEAAVGMHRVEALRDLLDEITTTDGEPDGGAPAAGASRHR